MRPRLRHLRRRQVPATGGELLDLQNTGYKTELRCVWGSSGTDVIIGGADGLARFDGTSWKAEGPGTYWAQALWGWSASQVLSVGLDGNYGNGAALIIHHDGKAWSTQLQGGTSLPVTTFWLNSVWASSPSEVFAAGGEGAIVRYDGTKWSTLKSGTTANLAQIWGSSATDVYVVGNSQNCSTNEVLRYSGAGWVKSFSTKHECLNAIWGTSHTNVFVAGSPGSIRRFDGKQWTRVRLDLREPGPTRYHCPDFYGMGQTSSGTVYAVGSHGAVYRHCAGSKCPP